ncbi:unnamed protein product [Haemonchus placei]|uniref:Uncharacterized protein n=1 Tax=Haemonchus placei TaxID=6290 RepID=A0A0N4WZG7_HAEPC|nr:unnamed protein product [Haemonchus placei]
MRVTKKAMKTRKSRKPTRVKKKVCFQIRYGSCYREGLEDDTLTSEADTEVSSTTEMYEEKTEKSGETSEIFYETTETSVESTETSGEIADAEKKDDEQEEASGSGIPENSSTTETPLIVGNDESESSGQEGPTQNRSSILNTSDLRETYVDAPLSFDCIDLPEDYDSALKKRDQMQKSQASRKEAGQACSAVDGDPMGTDYAGFGTEVYVIGNHC